MSISEIDLSQTLITKNVLKFPKKVLSDTHLIYRLWSQNDMKTLIIIRIIFEYKGYKIK